MINPDTASQARIRVMNTGPIGVRCGEVTLPAGTWVEVPVDFLSSHGATPNLKFDFSAMSEHLRTRSADGRPAIDFWSPLSVVDGYGRHALDIHRGLGAIGIDAELHASQYVDRAFMDAGVIANARENNRRPPCKVGVSMSVPYDEVHINHNSVVRIAITQFETDHVPELYVDRINQCDHLITTSTFQPAVWRKSGLKIPISLLTPGVDTDWFAYRDRQVHGTFNVLLLGTLSPRKNTVGAIRMFQEASLGNPDWRLTIKSRGHLQPEVKQLEQQDRRIKVVFGDAPPQAIRQLYYDNHCFLWPSKGEGVGLPPLEAMATGMELVCSDNSGMSDYVSENWCYPVRSEGQIRADAPGETFTAAWVNKVGNVGSYWRPDHGHGVNQLRKCFNNWMDGKGRGRHGAEYVRKHHTLEIQAESVWNTVKDYL